MKGRILFADNIQRFLNVRREFLEAEGYEVFIASTIDEAEQVLKNERIHLAILDIRMGDDNDDGDFSGLDLAKDEAYSQIPKIILTGFPSYEAVREALGFALNGLPPAVKFLAKKEGAKAMVQAVEAVFSEYVRLNPDLIFHWAEHLSFLHLVNMIEPGLGQKLLLNRAGELEDLFRRLFCDSSQITIARLLACGKQGVVLTVFDFAADRTENQFIVICGQRAYVQVQADYYKTFIAQGIGEGSLIKMESTENIHFAATAYALSGGKLDEITPLTEFYQHNSLPMVKSSFDHLLTTTLAPWHEKGRFLAEDKSLYDLFLETARLNNDHFAPDKLESQIKALCQESLSIGLSRLDYFAHQLRFYLPDGSSVTYPNPIPLFSSHDTRSDTPIVCSNIHGQLSGASILVDRQGRTWLIDFNQTRQGPLLYDFVSLEVAVKFELLPALDINTWYEIEKRLLTTVHLNDQLDSQGLDPDSQKAIQIISCVRQRAAQAVGNDLKAYLTGLIFCTAKQIVTYRPEMRHTRPEMVPYVHSLLSMAMVYEQLAPPLRSDLPPQANDSVWVDETNHLVWVEGRQVTLNPREFKLLLYLYHHSGQLCTRTTIAEQVFEMIFVPGLTNMEKRQQEEGPLNSTMSRLRKKLEPNPNNPKYIVTVRGEGYKLNL